MNMFLFYVYVSTGKPRIRANTLPSIYHLLGVEKKYMGLM